MYHIKADSKSFQPNYMRSKMNLHIHIRTKKGDCYLKKIKEKKKRVLRFDNFLNAGMQAAQGLCLQGSIFLSRGFHLIAQDPDQLSPADDSFIFLIPLPLVSRVHACLHHSPGSCRFKSPKQ